MKVSYVSNVSHANNGPGLYLRMESLFDRWDMEKWIHQMVPAAKVYSDDTVKELLNNELVIHGTASDLSKIRLIC